jgi:hypothetical protein
MTRFRREDDNERTNDKIYSIDLTHHERQTHGTSSTKIFKLSENRLRRLNSRGHSQNDDDRDPIKDVHDEQNILQER